MYFHFFLCSEIRTCGGRKYKSLILRILVFVYGWIIVYSCSTIQYMYTVHASIFDSAIGTWHPACHTGVLRVLTCMHRLVWIPVLLYVVKTNLTRRAHGIVRLTSMMALFRVRRRTMGFPTCAFGRSIHCK